MTVLAFIFDHLLLGNLSQNSGTPPISKVARSFLQCLATIQYPQDAILILVNEFKLAFQRALSLAESQLKHMRIRTLASLLSQILDAPNNGAPRMTVNPTNFSRLLIRRGFISDLARATHSLSLNSSHLVGTVNNILKPLEVLTRIVNQVALSQHRTGTVGGGIPPSNRPTTTSATQTTSNRSNFRSILVGTGTHPATPPTTSTSQVPPTGTQATPQIREDQPSNPELGTPNVISTPRHPAQASASTPVAAGGARQLETDTSFLEATHESLIPLEEEEDDEREREQRREIITLAQELGRQHREELTVAASGDMDIQVSMPISLSSLTLPM